MDDRTNYSVPYQSSDPEEMIDARKISAKKVFKKKRDVLIYVYDYGDHWAHTGMFIDVIDEDGGNCLVCTGGEGACPPEDVGGIHGYKQMLDVFKKRGEGEKRAYTERLGLLPGEKWKAEFCSLREANKRIAMLLSEF